MSPESPESPLGNREETGIPEDQSLQRTQDFLDMMIAEEETMKESFIKSIAIICQKELNTLYSELHGEPIQEEREMAILHLETDLHTKVKLMQKPKKGEKTETETTSRTRSRTV